MAVASPLPRLGGFDRTIRETELIGRRVCADCVWMVRFPGPAPTLAALRERVAGQLGAMPWLTARLAPTALRLGGPWMVPDPEFELERHVLVLPSGLDREADWLDFVATELAASLAGRRPLWSLHLAAGDGGFAVILRLHHLLADGKAGSLVLRTLLGDPLGAPAAATTAPVPPPLALTWHGIREALAGLRRWDDRRGRAAGAVGWRLPLTLTAAFGRWLRGPRPPRLAALNGTLGPSRRVGFVSVPIEVVQAISARSGAFPNEVYLALVGGGLRRYLARHGVEVDLVPDLQVGTMVDVGGRRDRRRLGNHYAAVRVPLNLGERDPRRRLEAVRAALSELRAGPAIPESVALVEAMARAPRPLVRLVAWIITSPRMTLNTIASHLVSHRGLDFDGVAPDRVCSWTYLPAGHSLSFVCQLSPAEMTLNVMADPEAIADLELLLEDLRGAREELLEASSGPAKLSKRSR